MIINITIIINKNKQKMKCLSKNIKKTNNTKNKTE